MKTKDFFGKFVNVYLLGNLLAMVLVIVALCLGVKYGLEWYTHHGEGIKVPKIEGMSFTNARTLILEDGLNIMVADSGYNKKLPANCVLAQNPGPGTLVKSGHTIYVTVNSPSSPTFAIPDFFRTLQARAINPLEEERQDRRQDTRSRVHKGLRNTCRQSHRVSTTTSRQSLE